MSDQVPVYVHLLRAKDRIDRDFGRSLDVPTLAREAHASTAHFARSFRRAFGETPHRYLQLRRIERAKELLRGTDLSVTEVRPRGRLPQPRLFQRRIPPAGRRAAERVRGEVAS